jgi:polyhydroxybutyrate depolymerase
MRRLLTAAFACLLIAAPALAERATPAKPETLTVSAAGTPREAILYAPDAATGPRPVVLVFHGGGGGAEWMANKSARLTRTLTGAGYAVVYMNGSTKRRTDKLRTWNAVHCCAYAARAKINEAAYADAVIDALAARIEIDRTRIFLMGHSNGAMLSYRLAGQMQTTPRAIAPISGAIFADQPDVPDRTSIFMYHAVDDEVLSYDGNPEDKAERWRTAPHIGFIKAEAKLAELKDCSPQSSPPSEGGVQTTERAGPGSSTLVAITSPTGGHEWASKGAGYPIEDAILAFFERQR